VPSIALLVPATFSQSSRQWCALDYEGLTRACQVLTIGEGTGADMSERTGCRDKESHEGYTEIVGWGDNRRSLVPRIALLVVGSGLFYDVRQRSTLEYEGVTRACQVLTIRRGPLPRLVRGPGAGTRRATLGIRRMWGWDIREVS
jgi:hypothetical protein